MPFTGRACAGGSGVAARGGAPKASTAAERGRGMIRSTTTLIKIPHPIWISKTRRTRVTKMISGIPTSQFLVVIYSTVTFTISMSAYHPIIY